MYGNRSLCVFVELCCLVAARAVVGVAAVSPATMYRSAIARSACDVVMGMHVRAFWCRERCLCIFIVRSLVVFRIVDRST